ncbi:MAG: 4-hydroxybutyrate dehydrogenase [Erythrobacter sp. SCN 62-14]|nr:MAG: 4-hydroxybutyrate dehydrogenase [Erythrobacter sp. SCN 62-14]
MALLNYLNTTHFDFGALAMLAPEAKRLGITRPMIATDAGVRAAGLLDKALEAWGDPASVTIYDETPGNPTERAVLAALEIYQAQGCDGVICLGGGSPMDLGKAVALLARCGTPLAQYDPLAGGRDKAKDIAPLIAIPTTSGTGSEASLGFVIIMEDGRKLTFASPLFIPKVAICDPELTLGLPPAMTAATGMDAITHCIEAFLTPVVHPPAEGVALDGLRRGWRHIERAVADGSDRQARWEMMMASTEGALAFVKGLGAVHAMSHAAGRIEELRLHHGTLNALFLPAVLRFNADVCEEKYARLREAMGLAPGADLADAVADLNQRIGMPAGLAAMGVTEDHVPGIIEFSQKDLAARSNPRRASADDYAAMIAATM